MKTKITKLLNISYPILQGGMASVSESTLAAAVSEGGGIGIIASGNSDAETLRKEIKKAKEKTDKPFGVNVILLSPHVEEIAQMLYEEKVALITTGAGNPGKYIPLWHEAGSKVIPVVPSTALAKRMERAGADAVIAEGCESGGHIGELTTMALLPQVVDAVQIPVIAAGGIADGRGIFAAMILGAEGVQMGTRFLASEECQVHPKYKELLLKAKDTDTSVTGRNVGRPVRQIKNRFTKNILTLEKQDASPEEFEKFTVGSLRKAVLDGDTEKGSFMAGQIAGMVNQIQPAAEILQELMNQTKEIFEQVKHFSI